MNEFSEVKCEFLLCYLGKTKETNTGSKEEKRAEERRHGEGVRAGAGAPGEAGDRARCWRSRKVGCTFEYILF